MDETRQLLVAELRRQVEGDETSASVVEGRGDMSNIKQTIITVTKYKIYKLNNTNYKIRQRLCIGGAFQQVEMWDMLFMVKA